MGATKSVPQLPQFLCTDVFPCPNGVGVCVTTDGQSFIVSDVSSCTLAGEFERKPRSCVWRVCHLVVSVVHTAR